jgi:hypothetical protein
MTDARITAAIHTERGYKYVNDVLQRGIIVHGLNNIYYNIYKQTVFIDTASRATMATIITASIPLL